MEPTRVWLVLNHKIGLSSVTSTVWFRLLFEARNQKKEAKEIAVIQAMKRKEEEKIKERPQAVLNKGLKQAP